MATPYLGSRVSLISSSEVRYEGILYTIDPKESTVALQNVKCCGTEDRPVDPAKRIPASDTVYEFIIFKGENIKHLHVTDTTKRPPDDPAIMNVIERPKEPPRQSDYSGGRKPQQWTLSSPQRQRGQRDRGGYQDRRGYNQDDRRPAPPREHDNRDYRDGRDGGGGGRNRGYRNDRNYDNRGDRDYRPRRNDNYNRRRDFNRRDGRDGRDQGGYEDGYRGNNNRNQNRNGRYRNDRRQRDNRNRNNYNGGGGNRRRVDMNGKEGKGEFLAGERERRSEIEIDKNTQFDFDAANDAFSSLQIEDNQAPPENQEPTDVAQDHAGDEPDAADAEAAHQLGQDVDPDQVKYDQETSFFDDLSTDRSVREKRKSRNEQRVADKEAFGDVAHNYTSKHQRRRQYRRKGYGRRGGYRGRGNGGRGRGGGRRWQNRPRQENL